jgi:hypothetical protein
MADFTLGQSTIRDVSERVSALWASDSESSSGCWPPKLLEPGSFIAAFIDSCRAQVAKCLVLGQQLLQQKGRSEENANCPQTSQVHFISFEIAGLI